MEKIRMRSMPKFVLSSLLNFGIGFGFAVLILLFVMIIAGPFVNFGAFMGVCLVFGAYVSLLTANLYRIYFYYQLSVDVNSVCKGDGLESDNYVIAMVLSALTFGIYGWYWLYKLGQRMRANAPRYGFKMLETGKEIVVLNVLSFGFVGAWELIKNMNRFAQVYNQTGLAQQVGGVQ